MILFQLAPATLGAGAPMAAGPDASKGTLSGNVRDPQGAAIAGARVDVVCGSDRRQSMSGPTGEFSISGLPQSRCLITASSALFDAATAEVDLSKGEARTTLVMPIPAFETSV